MKLIDAFCLRYVAHSHLLSRLVTIAQRDDHKLVGILRQDQFEQVLLDMVTDIEQTQKSASAVSPV